MPENEPPSEEEVDEFLKLYQEHESKKAVAERVDWSRATVSKWLDRRFEELNKQGIDPLQYDPDAEEEQQTNDEGGGDGPGGEQRREEPTDSPTLPESLVSEPESPNDILIDIIKRDPKLGDDEIQYIKQFFDDYGQLSPSDVTDILSDLSINSKRMTIGRINRHYEKAVNRRLREDPDLKYDERWATLLTKVTGDNSYIRQAQQYDVETSMGGIQPPTGSGQQSGLADGSGGITPPPDSPTGGNQQPGPQQPPNPDPQQRRGESPGAFPRGQAQRQPPQQPPQQQGGEDSLSPFEKRLLEMLEQQIQDDPNPQPEPQEPKGATDQIQELLELQQKMEELQSMAGGEEESNEQIEQVMAQFQQQIARLEDKIGESNQQPEPAPAPSPDDTGDSMFSEIAMLAEKVDDPDMLSMLIETQTDPEVLEARAKKEEVKNDTEWKKALAQSLSPAAAEKAIDGFLNLTNNMSNAAQQRQAAQRAQQQPTQRRQPQQQAQTVEAVDEPAPEQAEPATADPTQSRGEESPLREEGVDNLENGEADEAEAETDEEGE